MRKHEAISLLKLYSTCSAKEWNEFLTRAFVRHDLAGLAKTRYSLQAGMTDLVNQKMNTQKMQLWFIRLQNSIEITMKKILRSKEPNPCDNPLIAVTNVEYKSHKNTRDHDLELFFKKSSY